MEQYTITYGLCMYLFDANTTGLYPDNQIYKNNLIP